MARLNDNNIGSISGAVRDMVSESTNRAMNGHSLPEAPKYAETDVFRPRPGPARYVLAAVLLVAALLVGLYLLSRTGDRRSSPPSWEFGRKISAEDRERYESEIERLGKTIHLTEAAPGIWQITEGKSWDKRISYDDDLKFYSCYTASDPLYYWYNTDATPYRWLCWYAPISADYGDYGWMECRGGVWYVEEDSGSWVRLPEKYDTAQLWSIQSE